VAEETNTIIDLLRHGETIGSACFRGSTDDPLTEHGWVQMREATVAHGSCWDHIITSPLKRCADFAHMLGQQHSLPLTLDERFKEMHFGTWEGRSASELMTTDADALTQFWNNPLRHTPPQAESLADFEARVLSAWRDIVTRCIGEKTLLITHGGVIRVLLCHIRQHPIERLLEFEVGHAAMQHIHI
jgi:alpha-ribazole phosphatase